MRKAWTKEPPTEQTRGEGSPANEPPISILLTTEGTLGGGQVYEVTAHRREGGPSQNKAQE